MKRFLSIVVFTLLLASSCTKGIVPDFLPGTWYGEFQCEVFREFNGKTSHYTAQRTVEITYLSQSKSYDVEATDHEYMPEPPTTNKTIFQFHLRGNKIIIDSGEYFLFNGATIQTVDEKNLILKLGATVVEGQTTTITYPNQVHFRRQD